MDGPLAFALRLHCNVMVPTPQPREYRENCNDKKSLSKCQGKHREFRNFAQTLGQLQNTEKTQGIS